MLEAEVRHVIAQGEQEMIVVIVPRAKELAGLRHQIREALLHFRAHLERRCAVRHHVDLVMNRFAGRRQVHGSIVFSGNHRRIH